MARDEKQIPRRVKTLLVMTSFGFKRCLHVKDDGTMCQAPAMRRRSCCYFHTELRRRARRKQKARMDWELGRQTEAQAAIALNLLRIRNLIDKELLSKILRELCVEA